MYRHVLSAFVLLTVSVTAQAELHDRGGGFIYDDVMDITWLRDADGPGPMNWHDSVTWAGDLEVYDSVRDVTWTDWRLPKVDRNFDGIVVNCAEAPQSSCLDNELGYLYHYQGISQRNQGPFWGIQLYHWSRTEVDGLSGYAWRFGMGSGLLFSTPKGNASAAWAVRAGDVAAVPVDVDVDPWDDANIVKPETNDSIVVAIMGSATFDVTQISPESLKLGVDQAENIAVSPLYGQYNDDAITDVAFIFKTAETGISCVDTEVTLTGSAPGPLPFSGTSPINTLGCREAVMPLDNPTPFGNDIYGDRFGHAVSISAGRVLVGAYYDDTTANNSGSAFLFNAITGELEHVFESTSPDPYYDYFGVAVSLDGDRVLIGAETDISEQLEPDSGTAYLYDAVTGNLVHTLDNPSPKTRDFFGSAVSVSGDRVLIGAYGDDALQAEAGRAYLFDAVTGTLVHTLDSPSPTQYERFGRSVSVDGDTIVIGTDNDRVYVFDAVSGNHLHTILSPEPSGGYAFGEALDVSGGTIVIGDYIENTNGARAGRAYLFDAVTGNYLRTLEKPAPESYEYFGIDVSIHGDRVLVGADRVGSVNSYGRAYLFNAVTGSLEQTYENPVSGYNNFATAVGVSADKAVIGAYFDPTTGGKSGRAYVFFDGVPANIEVVPSLNPPFDEDLHLNHRGGGVPDDRIPVVVVGQDSAQGDEFDLDVSLIDVASLRFGPGRAAVDPDSTPNLGYNHNDDGIPDALFEFRMSETGFPTDDISKCFAPSVLIGEMQVSGERFAGEDLDVSVECDAECH